MEHGKHIQACRRCGTCCEKGGPSFHMADKKLIEKGGIHTRDLYTIRKGEKVHDNVMDGFITADTDIIKIKGQNHTWTCRFYDVRNRTCTIYAKRPLECRVLKCWDTRDIRELYQTERLRRKDLLKDIQGLWPLIEDHEQRCSYRKLALAVKDLEGSFQKAAISRIMEMVRYDIEIRKLVVEKGNIESGMTDFLFGRPLTKTIVMYGYRVKGADGKYSLVRV
jgi:Fe-S-cluster containining protein